MNKVYLTQSGNVTHIHHVNPAVKNGMKRAAIQLFSSVLGAAIGICFAVPALEGLSPREAFDRVTHSANTVPTKITPVIQPTSALKL